MFRNYTYRCKTHFSAGFFISFRVIMCHSSKTGYPLILSIVFSFVILYHGTDSSLPITTAPLIENSSFVVIWNAPTPVCKELDIDLDFSAFQEITTPGSEPDQFLFLFYFSKLGLYPYTDPITGMQCNGGIPQKGNLTASQEKASQDIATYIPKFTPGLAVIDWESWRPLWARNWGAKDIYRKLSIQYAKEIDPSLSSSEEAIVAKEQFQKAARAYMEETMKLGIRFRPKYLWGYYLFPDCYNYGWEKPGYTGECPELEQSRNDELLWLWKSSTVLFPSVYLLLSLRENPKAALYVRGHVKEAMRVAALPKPMYTPPIYVYSRPVFTDQNNVYLSETDLVRTIGESAALGASGAVLWGASNDFNKKSSCEALAAYLPETMNPYVVNVTAASKLCSQTLCQGNGRCVRKNPDTDDYLHLNPDHFLIQQWNGKYQAVGVLSQSDIDFFVNAFTCQCYVNQKCSAKISISLPNTPVIIQV